MQHSQEYTPPHAIVLHFYSSPCQVFCRNHSHVGISSVYTLYTPISRESQGSVKRASVFSNTRHMKESWGMLTALITSQQEWSASTKALSGGLVEIAEFVFCCTSCCTVLSLNLLMICDMGCLPDRTSFFNWCMELSNGKAAHASSEPLLHQQGEASTVCTQPSYSHRQQAIYIIVK